MALKFKKINIVKQSEDVKELTMKLMLAHHPLNQLSPLDSEITQSYKELTADISQLVSPEHALLFAEPKMVNDIVYWYADGQEAIPWKALSKAKQKEVLQVIRSILADMTSVAYLYPRSHLSRSLPNCGCFPSQEYIYLVDGRPVITAWGYSGDNGLYNPLANEKIKISQKIRQCIGSRFPWVTALIALFVGILTALLWNIYHHIDKACYGAYPQIQEVEDALKDQNKNQELKNKQDGLSNTLVLSKKQCHIPPVHPLKSEETPQIAPLRKDAWEKKDKSMLNGCWHLTTPLNLVVRETGVQAPVKTWQVCFDNSGKGNQTITKIDNISCRGPILASFEGDQLIIKQPENCRGGFNLVQGTQVCTRLNDKEATCLYKDDDVLNSKGVTGTFER
ncbi:hypothetical protein [Commensalibacter nepenthis]|uniref:Uncharacterized protein n=1 Tax=Commensalibacter nepenthis TaxID=3043872 RepID=A0ABT6Q9W3_9PROT|nr:hypothetical protein [Commensalibacter sp. TBRC 10068]MDI2113697.1 hypothetical protein [Commensalibacter sp. TBRC 10068]